ncbi:hypothetical protein HAX54_031721 [Datura stramonium]|uniref:Uncharacterized protein n=1 Tax=Datura stramonium TaxID=4076 RepID=A0ABS8VCR8_DATST|nr:hypothetical protein [Datura stramonium]
MEKRKWELWRCDVGVRQSGGNMKREAEERGLELYTAENKVVGGRISPEKGFDEVNRLWWRAVVAGDRERR